MIYNFTSAERRKTNKGHVSDGTAMPSFQSWKQHKRKVSALVKLPLILISFVISSSSASSTLSEAATLHEVKLAGGSPPSITIKDDLTHVVLSSSNGVVLPRTNSWGGSIFPNKLVANIDDSNYYFELLSRKSNHQQRRRKWRSSLYVTQHHANTRWDTILPIRGGGMQGDGDEDEDDVLVSHNENEIQDKKEAYENDTDCLLASAAIKNNTSSSVKEMSNNKTDEEVCSDNDGVDTIDKMVVEPPSVIGEEIINNNDTSSNGDGDNDTNRGNKNDEMEDEEKEQEDALSLRGNADYGEIGIEYEEEQQNSRNSHDNDNENNFEETVREHHDDIKEEKPQNENGSEGNEDDDSTLEAAVSMLDTEGTDIDEGIFSEKRGREEEEKQDDNASFVDTSSVQLSYVENDKEESSLSSPNDNDENYMIRVDDDGANSSSSSTKIDTHEEEMIVNYVENGEDSLSFSHYHDEIPMIDDDDATSSNSNILDAQYENEIVYEDKEEKIQTAKENEGKELLFQSSSDSSSNFDDFEDNENQNQEKEPSQSTTDEDLEYFATDRDIAKNGDTENDVNNDNDEILINSEEIYRNLHIPTAVVDDDVDTLLNDVDFFDNHDEKQNAINDIEEGPNFNLDRNDNGKVMEDKNERLRTTTTSTETIVPPQIPQDEERLTISSKSEMVDNEDKEAAALFLTDHGDESCVDRLDLADAYDINYTDGDETVMSSSGPTTTQSESTVTQSLITSVSSVVLESEDSDVVQDVVIAHDNENERDDTSIPTVRHHAADDEKHNTDNDIHKKLAALQRQLQSRQERLQNLLKNTWASQKSNKRLPIVALAVSSAFVTKSMVGTVTKKSNSSSSSLKRKNERSSIHKKSKRIADKKTIPKVQVKNKTISNDSGDVVAPKTNNNDRALKPTHASSSTLTTEQVTNGIYDKGQLPGQKGNVTSSKANNNTKKAQETKASNKQSNKKKTSSPPKAAFRWTQEEFFLDKILTFISDGMTAPFRR